MDIGPVNAIRPVQAVRPSPPGSGNNPDLTGVFATEFRHQQRDDSYSPSRNPSRGLEDEDDDLDPEPANETTPEFRLSPSSNSISFFA
ncbi:hypothetical protein [Occallatibacter riparius]|uniref:Uncharacterized protein n=1 Tax=Occallatibacter riparius TaxID=1002689 RepID=A0A9J7BNI2_9BACT|nr:hypothetical protein [Occallatibacter riparius]UWZ82725.1 hypothetical protein MOP44_19400 [Occallatibacter riparius]